jgi:hypothetical protein
MPWTRYKLGEQLSRRLLALEASEAKRQAQHDANTADLLRALARARMMEARALRKQAAPQEQQNGQMDHLDKLLAQRKGF